MQPGLALVGVSTANHVMTCLGALEVCSTFIRSHQVTALLEGAPAAPAVLIGTNLRTTHTTRMPSGRDARVVLGNRRHWYHLLR